MRNLRRFFKKAQSFFGNTRVEEELEREISSHLALLEEDFQRKGMTPRDAHLAARRACGVEQAKQMHRDERSILWLERVLQDLRFSLRMLAKDKGLTFTIVATLALGIGANTAVFSVVNSVLIKPLPYTKAEELVGVWQTAPGAGLANFSTGLRLSPSMYFTYAEQNRTFQSLGVWIAATTNVTGLAEPEQAHTVSISDGVLQALRVPSAAAGRWLLPADQNPHGPKTVMLSYGYWQRRFGADPSVIGRNINVDSQLREIVGVMPRGFRLINADSDLVVPLAFDRSKLILAGFGYEGIARLKPGVTIAQADADLARMVPIWMDSWSNGPGIDSHFLYETWRITPAIRSLKQEVIGNVGNALWVVMTTVGIVMLIACANVANLLLVRTEARQQELAIRAALGAGRGRIVRQLLLESSLLGLIGGALGVALAYAGLRLLVTIGPANLPRLSEISLDARALGFTLVLSLLSSLLFGSIPALKYAGPRIPPGLQIAGRTASVSRERHHSRNFLVITQLAMALVLLVSAGLMIRTFEALRTVDPGFADAEHLQTMHISIPDSLIANPQLVTRIQNNIADKLATIPGVTSIGFAGAMPMEGIEPNWNAVYVEGKNYAGEVPPLRLFNYVSPGVFSHRRDKNRCRTRAHMDGGL